LNIRKSTYSEVKVIAESYLEHDSNDVRFFISFPAVNGKWGIKKLVSAIRARENIRAVVEEAVEE